MRISALFIPSKKPAAEQAPSDAQPAAEPSALGPTLKDQPRRALPESGKTRPERARHSAKAIDSDREPVAVGSPLGSIANGREVSHEVGQAFAPSSGQL